MMLVCVRVEHSEIDKIEFGRMSEPGLVCCSVVLDKLDSDDGLLRVHIPSVCCVCVCVCVCVSVCMYVCVCVCCVSLSPLYVCVSISPTSIVVCTITKSLRVR